MNAELVPFADPAAEARYRAVLARESFAAGYAEGLADGAVGAAAAIKAAQHGCYANAQLEARRWHVCCKECRRRGHRDGCTRCEDRDRETFGEPHPDDYNRGDPR